MALIASRVSGLWETPLRMTYFEGVGAEEDVEGLISREIDMCDDRTPLDKTIDRIGMGKLKFVFSFLSSRSPDTA